MIQRDSIQELGQTDLVLGVISRAEYNNRTVQLVPGDSLVVFTDGLSEAENADRQEIASAMLQEKPELLHEYVGV